MSRSRHPSSLRPGLSGAATPPIISGENLVLLDAPVSQENAQLLHHLVHPRHADRNETPIEVEIGYQSSLPWYKKPSPIWLLALLPITTIAMGATVAPKVEIYTALACIQHRPDMADIPGLPSVFDLTSYNEHHWQAQILTASASSCKSDPVVQAAVAKLATVMTASMGVLGCLTTGWWSSFSDRHGRTMALGISVFGVLLTDATFILVYYRSRSLPGGYWFLLLGPLVEGSLGGFTTAGAVMHAYLADTTTLATRSRIFSMNLGLIFVGFALGPTLGGLLIRFTRQTISVFYAASCSHLIYAFMVWFIVPESNSKPKMQLARAKYQEEIDLRRTREGRGPSVRTKRLFSFLSPLAVFSPVSVSETGNPLKPARRDWNLTLLALSYAFIVSVMGSYTYTFQYAAATFNWTSEQATWLLVKSRRRHTRDSLGGTSSALYQNFQEKTKPAAPSTSSETITPSDTASSPRLDSPSRLTEPHSGTFDLGLAGVSLVVEAIAYILMGVASNALSFTTSAMLGSMGAGFSPALQSVALEIYNQRGGVESGKLFGALSVVQALSSQIVGPALYGLVYVKTVAIFPRTIFFVSVASAFLSLVFLSLVRLPRLHGVSNEAEHPEDAPAVDLSTGHHRGRLMPADRNDGSSN
ncbi:hypothetical protein D9757_003673 [Collybiopsis confluens]|uniref:MFS general substrate transporter n=1 Tax=Collybiopsis confluens TaxID=2823264 RepID=A0A8H5HUH7_9AGAR|nr:hypothetical protein D9757_003673 [Collybiopsis confluens]